MRICTDHWARLREAIEARGLSALVADSGEKAASNLVSELSEGRTLDNYDPLMAAHNAILSNSLNVLGLAVFQGHNCPLCTLNEQARQAWQTGRDEGHEPGVTYPCPDPGCPGHEFPAEPNSYDEWIDRAADDQVAAWKAITSTEGNDRDS